jgi:hypothetical protein
VTLWLDVPIRGAHPVRKIERRLALTAEYGAKAISGLLGWLASPPPVAADDELYAWIENAPETLFQDKRIARVADAGPRSYIVRLPRREPFTRVALDLDAKGVRFRAVAGNDDILLTAIVAGGGTAPAAPARLISSEPLLTDPQRVRVAIGVPMASLHDAITQVQAAGGTIEHLYDY